MSELVSSSTMPVEPTVPTPRGRSAIGTSWVRTADRGWVRADQICSVAVARTASSTAVAEHETQVVVTLPGMCGDPIAGLVPHTAVIARFPAHSPSTAHRAVRELIDALINYAAAPGVLVTSIDGRVTHHGSVYEAEPPHQVRLPDPIT